MNRFLFCLFLSIGCWAVQAAEQPAHTGHDASVISAQEMDKKWKEMLAKPSYAVTAAFDENGRLWRASVREGYVLANYSDDGGKSYSQPVKVNAEAENILGDGENRPRIAFAHDGAVLVSWARRFEERFTGDVRFARAADGVHFDPPVTVHRGDSITGHSFNAMRVLRRAA